MIQKSLQTDTVRKCLNLDQVSVDASVVLTFFFFKCSENSSEEKNPGTERAPPTVYSSTTTFLYLQSIVPRYFGCKLSTNVPYNNAVVLDNKGQEKCHNKNSSSSPPCPRCRVLAPEQFGVALRRQLTPFIDRTDCDTGTELALPPVLL